MLYIYSVLYATSVLDTAGMLYTAEDLLYMVQNYAKCALQACCTGYCTWQIKGSFDENVAGTLYYSLQEYSSFWYDVFNHWTLVGGVGGG
jgi:hypothetical protein